jgi:hypothetical protein
MRLTTVVFERDATEHEITVTRMAGTVDANVARWIGQLDATLTPDQVAERTRAALDGAARLSVDGADAIVVAMDGDSDAAESILGGIIPLDATGSLFVKFKGPHVVARQIRDDFIRFVTSIRWK